MDRRRPAHTIAIAVAALALLAGVAGDASAASRSGRQDPVASCDTAPGVTIRTGQRWRVFYPLLAGPDSSKQYVDVEGDEWACSRQPHSTRTFLDLGYWQGVRNLTGDLVQLDSYSRYGGFSSEIANLTTRKAQFVEQGDNYETDQPVNLLGSGAVALQSAAAAIFGT